METVWYAFPCKKRLNEKKAQGSDGKVPLNPCFSTGKHTGMSELIEKLQKLTRHKSFYTNYTRF
ncbi:MAG: hypothetical protein DRH24_08265 [Deltaproteobacteria bacterium]|nr:MAG: hypothetical protein DRH24_08265 [Deltaproteobacteria bacterium]